MSSNTWRAIIDDYAAGVIISFIVHTIRLIYDPLIIHCDFCEIYAVTAKR